MLEKDRLFQCFLLSADDQFGIVSEEQLMSNIYELFLMWSNKVNQYMCSKKAV